MNFRQATPWYLLALAIIVADQLTKIWVERSLDYGQSVEVTSFFSLQLAYNTGAAFSLLAEAGGWQKWLFTVIAISVSAALVIWMARLAKEERLLSVALGLVLGGALGNLYDRITLGHVVDFIALHYEHRYFPIFNIADSAITVGAVLLIWESLFVKKSAGDINKSETV